MEKTFFKKMLTVLFIVAISLVACTTLVGCGGGKNNNTSETENNGGSGSGGGSTDEGEDNTEETQTKKVYLKGFAIYSDYSKVKISDLTIKYNGEEIGRLSMDGAMTASVFHIVDETVSYDTFISKISLDVDKYYNYYIDTSNIFDFITENEKTIAEFNIMLREKSKGNIASSLVTLSNCTIGIVDGGNANLSDVKIFAVADDQSKNLVTTSNADGFQIKLITDGTKLKFEAPAGYVFAGVKIGNNTMIDASKFNDGIVEITMEHNNVPVRVFMQSAS